MPITHQLDLLTLPQAHQFAVPNLRCTYSQTAQPASALKLCTGGNAYGIALPTNAEHNYFDR